MSNTMLSGIFEHQSIAPVRGKCSVVKCLFMVLQSPSTLSSLGRRQYQEWYMMISVDFSSGMVSSTRSEWTIMEMYVISLSI